MRSDACLMGHPDLRGKDRLKVRLHNKIMYRVAELIESARAAGVHFAVENPESSWLWLTTPFKKIAADSHEVVFDFCQYGDPWRKRTKLLTSLAALEALACRCTSSAAHPLCSRSGKRHIQLSGVDPTSKQFWTLLACPYPKLLVRAIAGVLEREFG